jgi:hypothetical protein
MARSGWRSAGTSAQYRCREEACPRKAFTESIAEIAPRARLTGRLCRKAAGEVASGRSVSVVAAEYRVSWPVIHRHYAAHADAVLTGPDPSAVLGIDETRRGAPKRIRDEACRWVRTERRCSGPCRARSSWPATFMRTMPTSRMAGLLSRWCEHREVGDA